MQKIIIIASSIDAASMNMYEWLRKYFQQTQMFFDSLPVYSYKTNFMEYFLVCIQSSSVYAENIDRDLQAVFGEISTLIFVTKHDSRSGVASYCVHTQGNWNKNELGGNERELAITPVVLKHAIFQELYAQNTSDFEVVHECTHHGPSVQIPSVFVEIGSTHVEWSNTDCGKFVARCLLLVFQSYCGEKTTLKPVVTLFGGTHTCSNILRLCKEDKVLLAHGCANYAILDLTAEIIQKALDKTTLPTQIVIDYKSLDAQKRQKLLGLLDLLGLSYKKLHLFKKELE